MPLLFKLADLPCWFLDLLAFGFVGCPCLFCKMCPTISTRIANVFSGLEVVIIVDLGRPRILVRVLIEHLKALVIT